MVDFRFYSRELNRPGRKVDARDLSAELGQQHRVRAVPAAHVEHGLASQIPENSESKFFVESPAWTWRAVAFERQDVDGQNRRRLLLGHAIKEPSFLFPARMCPFDRHHGNLVSPPSSTGEQIGDQIADG